MPLSCGCNGICKGHPVVSPGTPGTLHAPTLLDALTKGACQIIERKAGMKEGALYNNGVGAVARTIVNSHPDIPKEPLTLPDWLRRAGILPEESSE